MSKAKIKKQLYSIYLLAVFLPIVILGSFLCMATGQISGDIFLKMFLGGVAFGAIPAVITKLGEEGIFSAKDMLYKLM